ncbi:MAG: hypothetical protein ABIH21_03330 [Patescibacteria group bacterium]
MRQKLSYLFFVILMLFASASFGRGGGNSLSYRCKSGVVFTEQGLKIKVDGKQRCAEAKAEARRRGLVPIPDYPGLEYVGGECERYTSAQMNQKLLGAAYRATLLDRKLIVTSAFRPARKRIEMACSDLTAGNPFSTRHAKGDAADVHMVYADGTYIWGGMSPAGRKRGVSIFQEQSVAPIEYTSVLASIMYGQRDGSGLYRLHSEVWHFEANEGPSVTNDCYGRPGSRGCE